MFIEIHHDPQQHARSTNKKKVSYINTDHIVAINVSDFSIATVSGTYIHVNGTDMMKVIEAIEII